MEQLFSNEYLVSSMKKVVLIIVMMFYLIDCDTRIYKMYEYESFEIDQNDIKFRGALNWTSKSENDTTICGESYSLMVAVESDDTINVKEITLQYKGSKELILSKNSKRLEPSTLTVDKPTQKILQYYRFANLSFEYEDLELKVLYAQNFEDHFFSNDLSKKYSQYKSNWLKDYIRAR